MLSWTPTLHFWNKSLPTQTHLEWYSQVKDYIGSHPFLNTSLPQHDADVPALLVYGSLLWLLKRVMLQEPFGPLEVWLDAGIHDLFRGLRSLLLATHWHTFTLIHTGLPLRREVANILRAPPLLPKFIALRHDAARHAIFRSEYKFFIQIRELFHMNTDLRFA